MVGKGHFHRLTVPEMATEEEAAAQDKPLLAATISLYINLQGDLYHRHPQTIMLLESLSENQPRVGQ